jgi:hypothetical protein
MNSPLLHVVPATDRVDRLQFSGLAEWNERVVHVGAYTCPSCGTEAEFNTGTLRKAEEKVESPLGTEWSARCNVERPLGAWEWALDFKCRGCNAPVRIIFAADGEYAMGSHNHVLVDVIEQEGGAR